MATEKKEDNLKVEDESTEKDTQPQSSDNQNSEDKAEKEEKSTPTPDTQYVPKEQFESVSKNLSKKDKDLSEIREELRQIKNRDAVKDLLLESELPEAVKSTLKRNIDILNPENFQSKSDEYLSIYESGRESYKNDQSIRVNNKPSPAEEVSVRDEIKSASDLSELEKAWSKIK